MARAEPMDDLALQSTVAAEIYDAVAYIDSDIGPQRAVAVDYYFGRPFGDEEDGRSQFVSRDVHDTIHGVLPSLMRIFFGSERVVEFVPESEDGVQLAEQATDYVNYVVTQDNDGFSIFYAVIKNALREKKGIVKFWWDERVEVTTKRFTGLTPDMLAFLMDDQGKLDKARTIDALNQYGNVGKVDEFEVTDQEQAEDGTLNITLKLKRKVCRVRVDALPPEEFLVSRDATSIERARLAAHRSMKTVSELVAMGLDRDLVEEQSQQGREFTDSQERWARNPYMDDYNAGPSMDQSQKLVLYVESYLYVDKDGDGIAELRRICTIGPSYKVVSDEEWHERPFADFDHDPEPHAVFGNSMADDTMDIQKVKSRVMRASLDSLAQSIYPRTVVDERFGYVEDALNTEVGAILRAKGPGAYEQLDTAFVGQQAFPMLTYMDEVRENRTGMSKVSMGLDAEALQNTTATAAEGQYTRSQERIELIARIMASGMRKLFRGVLRLLIENQGEPRMVKLGSGWQAVNPRAWREDLDVVCTVGLGGGSPQEKGRLLAMIAQKQEQIILQAGPNNPLVSMKQYFNTLSKLVELGGFRNPTAFFTDPESDEAKARQQDAPPPPPSPDMLKQQTEQRKLQQQGELGQADLDLRAQQMQMDADDRAHARWLAEQKLQLDANNAEQDRATDFALRLADINGRNQTQVTVANIKADAEALRAHADLLIQASEHQHAQEMADQPKAEQ